MAIEVSDGFGIVLGAIRLYHQKFAAYNIVTKYSALSKIPTNYHKNKLKHTSKPNSLATQCRAENTEEAATPKELRPSKYLIFCTIWLRG